MRLIALYLAKASAKNYCREESCWQANKLHKLGGVSVIVILLRGQRAQMDYALPFALMMIVSASPVVIH